ncbi:hypothetical protein [Thauera aminoaromatica]|uniref:hypothetical protein n=1 Tax=Thauera aminoaromatica TaxID=164330 RepID=UPI0035AEF0EA
MNIETLRSAKGVSMSGVNRLSSFMASIATQIRAAIQVGVPVEDDAKARRAEENERTLGPSATELWDDAPGRMTRNGLGSLEIGAGRTRVDE